VLNTEQAAALISQLFPISPRTLERARAGDRHGPPYARIGGRVFYHREAALSWANMQARQARQYA
jgi:hypothetical protein